MRCDARRSGFPDCGGRDPTEDGARGSPTTTDVVHGRQQLALFNAFENEYGFMPFHVYEGQSGTVRAYAAGTWSTPRRVVCRILVSAQDTDVHFVVTSFWAVGAKYLYETPTAGGARWNGRSRTTRRP